MPIALRFAVVPRAVLILMLLAVLVAAAIAGVAIGGRLSLSNAVAQLPPPTGPAGNGLIAFESGGDIWVVNPDGSGRRQLTSAPELEHSPAWSADGTRLAYWSQEALGAPPSVIVMNADGPGPATVASHEAVATGAAVLEPRRDVPADPYRLDWSPDGSHLAYSLGSGADERIHVAATDGSGSSVVGDPGLTAWWPDWSPDGTLLAFGASRSGVETGVYVMAPDGTALRGLSQVEDDGQNAFVDVEWSPDDQSIATQAAPSGPFSIWVIAADGSGELDISVDGRHPTWSPDGQWVMHSGGAGVKVVARDGGEAREFAEDAAIWSPDGTALAGLVSGTLVVLDAVSGEVRAEIEAPDGIRNHLNTPSWQRVAR